MARLPQARLVLCLALDLVKVTSVRPCVLLGGGSFGSCQSWVPLLGARVPGSRASGEAQRSARRQFVRVWLFVRDLGALAVCRPG